MGNETGRPGAAKSSFAEFVESHERQLRAAVARDRRVAPPDVDDAVQDAFERLMPVFHRLESDATAFAYAKVIAHNEVTTRTRDAIRRSAHPYLHAVHLVHAPTGAGDPAEAVVRDDTLLRALRQLPAAQRSAVVLVDLVEVSAAEAAAILGVTHNIVKGLLQRGRAALRHAMGGAVNAAP